MHIHVKVVLDGEGPVVVKVGTGTALDRLRHERDRLARAVHPGVVAMVASPRTPDGRAPGDSDDDTPGDRSSDPPGNRAGDTPADSGDDVHGAEELRTVYAGEPVSRWNGTIAGIAGLGAAVASTLSDLHSIGIVHGRVDDSHILIGRDGRPRLCGFSGPDGVPPAEDVAALGRVLRDLVARSADDRAGRRSWLRHRGPVAARHALERVIERATDPVPTRRPSARVLADAILTAVPGAELPAGGGAAAGPRHGSPTAPAIDGQTAGGVADEPPWPATPAEHDWQQPDTFDRIWSFGDTRSDDERWAAAFGSEPRDLPIRTATAAAGGPGLPLALIATPGWSTDDQPNRGTEQIGGDAVDAKAAGSPRSAPDHDDLTRDHRPVGMRVAPATPATPSPEIGRWWHGRLLGLGAGALAVAVVGAAVVIVGPGGDADTPRSDLAAAEQPDQPDTTTIAAGETCPEVSPPAADVDDDGCREALVVDGSSVDAGVARWSLGEPGDVAAVGDWDCDGQASAALLRPATGDVFLFGTWAAVDEPVTVAPTQRVAGGIGVRAVPDEHDPDGCDQLVVDLGGGRTTQIDVPEVLR